MDEQPPSAVLDELVELSLDLGRPELDYVILAEGNTSAACGDGTFWVKASGARLAAARPDSFVRVEAARVLAMLRAPTPDDAQVHADLLAARVGAPDAGKPSVETLMHAVCLMRPGVRFVGHVHPIPVNQILCSEAFPGAFAGRLFPDEIVLCGKAPLLVPYVDPGLPLAREIERRLAEFEHEHGRAPRVLLLQNHGLVVLGASAAQVAQVTAMVVKAAKILAATYALGGPRFLTPEAVARIDTRPDEHYRQRRLGLE